MNVLRGRRPDDSLERPRTLFALHRSARYTDVRCQLSTHDSMRRLLDMWVNYGVKILDARIQNQALGEDPVFACPLIDRWVRQCYSKQWKR
jgi:hypothetical protein